MTPNPTQSKSAKRDMGLMRPIGPMGPIGPMTPSTPRARATLDCLAPYQAPPRDDRIRLRFDANEGPPPDESILREALMNVAESVRRYPVPDSLESLLAARLGIAQGGILVTAGSDEAIDRLCRAYLEPGREIILPVPTFEIIRQCARAAGATVCETRWPEGPFPTAAVIDLITNRTGLIAIVSPNNPTGAVATTEDLRRISDAAPHAVLLVDLAYTEFADEDLTGAALSLPNAIITRTFSKAWGLAGLRVGYAAGSESLIRPLRALGTPFPCSAIARAAAAACIRRGRDLIEPYLASVRREREALTALAVACGARVVSSQANFVLVKSPRAASVHAALWSRGIAVRRFSDPLLADALRITCPGNDAEFAILAGALTAIFTDQEAAR